MYTITPYSNPHRTPYCWWEDAFTAEELNYLQNKAKTATDVAAIDGGVNLNVRRSQTLWLDPEAEENKWLAQRLGHIVSSLNAKFYNFNLTGFGEAFQLTTYKSSEQGAYTWHQDCGGQISRKLSLVLQLSDPSTYEGGNLQLLHGNTDLLPKKLGLIVAFPSWELHQVTPVTAGERHSLVCWVTGPEFR